MPYDKTLTFNALSDITFDPSADDIKIKVGGTLLGAINKNFPVTIFITESGSTKSITLKQIDPSVFTTGNTNDLVKDTIAYNYTDLRNDLHIDVCSGSSNKYKIIGWEEDQIGQTCTGSSGCSNYFEISAELNFKAKIEQVTYPNAVIKWKMVVRYSGDVKTNVSPSSALCYAGLYCYACN